MPIVAILVLEVRIFPIALVMQITKKHFLTRDGASGGLEGYNPQLEHASPPSEDEKLFVQDFPYL